MITILLRCFAVACVVNLVVAIFDGRLARFVSP